MRAFGKRLRSLREERGFSQSHLSALADIPKSQIARIEQGTVNTTISTVKALADALDIRLGQLFD